MNNTLVTETSNKKEILDGLLKMRESFYTTETKNRFFKNRQKERCNRMIVENSDVDTLLNRSVYIIENTNQIYIDYAMLKMFVTETMHQTVVDHIIECLTKCILTYGKYDLHLDLNGFTISAAERHKHVIFSFHHKCLMTSTNGGVKFEASLDHMYIYNTPSVIMSIRKIFSTIMSSVLHSKIIYYDKEESAAQLKKWGIE